MKYANIFVLFSPHNIVVLNKRVLKILFHVQITLQTHIVFLQTCVG